MAGKGSVSENCTKVRKLHKNNRTLENDMVTLSGVPPGMAPLFDPCAIITLKQIYEASTV
jgi:hypothetical protein